MLLILLVCITACESEKFLFKDGETACNHYRLIREKHHGWAELPVGLCRWCCNQNGYTEPYFKNSVVCQCREPTQVRLQQEADLLAKLKRNDCTRQKNSRDCAECCNQAHFSSYKYSSLDKRCKCRNLFLNYKSLRAQKTLGNSETSLDLDT